MLRLAWREARSGIWVANVPHTGIELKVYRKIKSYHPQIGAEHWAYETTAGDSSQRGHTEYGERNRIEDAQAEAEAVAFRLVCYAAHAFDALILSASDPDREPVERLIDTNKQRRSPGA